jgi:hypothetical protein
MRNGKFYLIGIRKSEFERLGKLGLLDDMGFDDSDSSE